MTLLQIALLSAGVLCVAYFTYGNVLVRLLRLNPKTETPAYELRDDVDFAPTDKGMLLGQHFSAIAAAGPIVGPILAGLAFGWLPALIWILVGSILIGGVHDLTALTASIRHKARSIAEVVREHMSRRSYLLFLTFIWIALVYIIVAFTDITAASFVGVQKLGSDDTPPVATAPAQTPAADAANPAAAVANPTTPTPAPTPAAAMNGAPSPTTAIAVADKEVKSRNVTGGWIASSSIMYLILPVIMGLLLKTGKISLNVATLIFVPLIALAIYVGEFIPFDLQSILGIAPGPAGEATTRKIWDVVLLAYCLIAGVTPVWLLLQPRGHLGGYFLYIALAAGAFGLLFSGQPIEYPQFRGWTVGNETDGFKSMFPYLFILIACGACSGFHSLIASGTTSKQLKFETDAKPIAYGSMLLEAMVAIISLSCVMILKEGSGATKGTPNQIYANGIGSYLEVLGIRSELAASFALMAFSTFVFDTLDVCTRLGKYIIQELIKRHDAVGAWIGTGLTAGVPIFFIMQNMVDKNGKPIPIWKSFWDLFGASNQLLAALTLLGVTVWLWRTRRAMWVWLVTGLPCVWMYMMSSWALIVMTKAKFLNKAGEYQLTSDPVAWAGVVLLALAALMLIEAIIVLLGDRVKRTPSGQLAAAGA
jgi:carbon starvation protein